MSDLVFQGELNVRLASEAGGKATIILNERGDLNLSYGNSKLSTQLMWLFGNDNAVVNAVLNTPVSARNLKILINLILRKFKQTQLDVVNNTDPNFSGYVFYRLNTGNNSYTKISTGYITYTFADTGLTNNTLYKYAIAKGYNGNFESNFVEKIAVIPTAVGADQEIVIGQNVVAIPGNARIDFYVVYMAKYMGSELLNNIVRLDVYQDTTDPRKWIVDVVVEDLIGNKVSVAAHRKNPST